MTCCASVTDIALAGVATTLDGDDAWGVRMAEARAAMGAAGLTVYSEVSGRLQGVVSARDWTAMLVYDTKCTDFENGRAVPADRYTLHMWCRGRSMESLADVLACLSLDKPLRGIVFTDRVQDLERNVVVSRLQAFDQGLDARRRGRGRDGRCQAA